MDSEDIKPGSRQRPPPEDDPQCVWVGAGVISTKICDMDFDCENCSLDAAIQRSFRGEARNAEHFDSSTCSDTSFIAPDREEARRRMLEAFFQRLEQFSLRDDRYYYRGHTWVQDGHRLKVNIGVDDFAARLLPHLNSVVFSPVESRVQQGDYFAWFVGSEGTIALVSPVTGTIVRVNDELYGMPDLVKTSPYETGWLAQVELDKFYMDLRKLLPRISATARFRKDLERLQRRFILYAGADSHAPSQTLLDGGKYVENVQSLLGPKKYVELISFLFRA